MTNQLILFYSLKAFEFGWYQLPVMRQFPVELPQASVLDRVHVQVPSLIQHDGQDVDQVLDRFVALSSHLDQVRTEVAVVLLSSNGVKNLYFPSYFECFSTFKVMK